MGTYTTIYAPAQDEFAEKRSRFIGYLAPVSTEEEAAAFIAEKRTQHWDATHNVYAYILRGGQTRRYSDDGEPQGTAGIPVLEVLQREALVDVVCVVTRYFGGVMLGAGGLVRAYAHGAKIAVSAARRMVMHECTELALELEYGLYGKISHFFMGSEAKVLSSDFGAIVRMQVLLRNEAIGPFEKALAELTAGQVVPQMLGQRWASLDE